MPVKPPATEKQLRKSKASAVAPIRPEPDAVEPPEGWVLDSPNGFMASDASNGGRLVRLVDLLHWLEQTRSLPRVAALDALCSAMPPDAMSWLFAVAAGDYAKPVPLGATFGYVTAAQIKQAEARAEGVTERYAGGLMSGGGRRERAGYGRLAGQVPTESGLPALLRLLRGTGNANAQEDATRAVLAIPIAKAYALWGYGEVQGAVDALDSAQSAQPNDWEAPGALQRLVDEIDEYDRKNKNGGKADAARRYGVTPPRVTELLKKHATKLEAAKPKAATPFSGLGASAKKAA